MTQSENHRFEAAVLSEQARHILRGWGMDAEDASITVDALIDCDLRGIDTHGISLLALYARWMAGGSFDLAVKPRIERDGPGYALIDGRGGLGFAVSVRATEMAVEKARATGIAGVSVRNSRHFGAAGYYARLAARAGMMSFVTTSTKVVCVVPPGAAEAVLGTNPLAYGIPRESGEPIVFDMATSTAAGNKVRLHQLKGQPIPEGWVVDGQGGPVSDPDLANRIVYDPSEAGGLTPLGATPMLGSHKGYGLALLVHFMGGALGGGNFFGSRSGHGRKNADGADNIGHYFLAIDPGVYRDMTDFFADVADVEDSLRQTPPVDLQRPVLLPGDIEERIKAERLRDGVPVAANLIAQLRDIAAGAGVPFLLEPGPAGGSS